LNILIIRPGALGDTLMLLPTLVDLAGKAAITFAGRQPGLEFVREYVYQAMDFEGPGWHRLFMERPEEPGLPVSGIDFVVAFFSDEDGSLRHNLKTCVPDAEAHVFPSFPPKGGRVHVARYISECLRSAGLPVDPQKVWEIACKGTLRKDLGARPARDKIVLHPGSGDEKKNYPPDFLLRLLGSLCREPALQGLRPVVLLGPAENSICKYFKKNASSIKAEIRIFPATGLLTRLLREAAIYLGHDSGITHLAAMLGTPTVALFKRTDADQWRPLGPYVRVLQNREAGPGLIKEVLSTCSTFLLSCLE
jgi:heptosyltransferase-3